MKEKILLKNKICPICGGVAVYSTTPEEEGEFCNQCKIKNAVMVKESRERKNENIKRWNKKVGLKVKLN